MNSDLVLEVAPAVLVKTNDELYEELLQLIALCNNDENDSQTIRTFINSNPLFPLTYKDNGALYVAATTNKIYAVSVLAVNEDVRKFEIDADFAVTRATLNKNIEFTSSQVIMHFIKKYHTIDEKKLKELGDLVLQLQSKNATADRGINAPPPQKHGFLRFKAKARTSHAAKSQSSLAVANVDGATNSEPAAAQQRQVAGRSRSRFSFGGCM